MNESNAVELDYSDAEDVAERLGEPDVAERLGEPLGRVPTRLSVRGESARVLRAQLENGVLMDPARLGLIPELRSLLAAVMLARGAELAVEFPGRGGHHLGLQRSRHFVESLGLAKLELDTSTGACAAGCPAEANRRRVSSPRLVASSARRTGSEARASRFADSRALVRSLSVAGLHRSMLADTRFVIEHRCHNSEECLVPNGAR